MADISKVQLPNDSTIYDIISKTGRGIVRCETDSSSTATAFVVNAPGVTELYEGLTLAIKNTVIVSASGCTINVNGLGAKSIWRSLSNSLLTSQWALNTEYLFVYDSTNERWIMQQGYDTNDDVKAYTVYRQHTGYKSGEISVFTNTLIMQRPNGTWESIVTSSSTELDKQPNPHGFLLYDILYWSGATVAPNSVIGTNNLVDQVTSRVDMRYSFNIANSAATGFATYAPVYIVGTLGNDGLFYLDNPWWTQTLPSTEDGKLYIYIGNSYDRYRMPFIAKHPIYRYANGMIRQYIPDAATVGGETIDEHFLSNDLTGNIVSFTTNYADLPLKKCILHIPITQTGSDTPSPDNIRDIVGVQGVNVSRTGKNLLDDSNKNLVGINIWFYGNSSTYKFWKAGTYMFSAIFSSAGISVFYTLQGASSSTIIINTTASGLRNLSFTIPQDGYYRIFAQKAGGITYDDVTNPMIAISNDLTYEPYTGNTYQITFGQTVYSANLDVLTGVLSVTHAYRIYNGSEDWRISSTGNNYYIEIGVNAMIQDTIIANEFENPHRAPTVDYIGIYNTSRFIQVRPSTAELDLQAWKTWLSTNPVKIAVKLAEPIEIQLTPTQITTLVGENVIFADVGTLDIQFIKSTVPWADTSASAQTVNGHTVAKDVPSDAVFTDTTYTGTGLISVNSSTHVISTTAEANVQSDWNATSGDAFIKNKPTIPTVNNATLTIQKNGSTVKTFTANASSNVTCNITVPTATSDLTNDSSFCAINDNASSSTSTFSSSKITDMLTPWYSFEYLDTSTNCANTTYVIKPPNVDVPTAGVYLCVAHVHFKQNANGIRELRIVQTRDGTQVGLSTGTTGPASNVGDAALCETFIFSANAGDRFSLQLYQSSGGTLAATFRQLQVYRLSPILMS